MANEIREIDFIVEANSVSPATPQFAGVQGDHNCTLIAFSLPAPLISEEYKYRFEYVDGTNDYDSSDFVTLEGNLVKYMLPQAWTLNGGTGEVRLVVSLLNASGNEEQIIYTFAGKLYFSSRETGLEKPICRGLSSLIEGAHEATNDAIAATEGAINATGNAVAATGAARAAEHAANNAADKANAAARDASHFYTLAQEQAEIATTQAGIATTQAGAALSHSETAATEAEKSADSAADSKAAKSAAELARDTSQGILADVNTLASQVSLDKAVVSSDKAAVSADKAAALSAKDGAEAAEERAGQHEQEAKNSVATVNAAASAFIGTTIPGAVQQVTAAGAAQVQLAAEQVTLAGNEADRAKDEADRATAIDAYTKGASDSRYLRSTVVEEPMTGGTAVLADADDGALASLRIEGVTRETGSGDKGPENPYTLSGVSPSIVRASGKNLFDNSGGWNPMTSGNDTVSNTSSGCQISSVAGGFGASTAALFPVTPGQTYTISGRWEQTTDYIAPVNGLRLNFYRTAERVDAQLGTQWKYTQKQQDISGTDTVPDGCYYAAINFYTGFSATQPVNGTLSNVQLEFGTAPTAYEPYRGKTVALPPIAPLYSLPDGTHDEYDPATGVEIRRVGAVELQNRPWAPYTPDGTVQDTLRSSVENGLIGYSTGTLPYCTHSNYDYQRWLYPDKGVGLTGPWTASSFIGWSAPGITPESFSAWLTAQKEAGTPVTVLYRLEKPVMTQHDPQTVPTYRENTSLQLDASAPGLLRYPLSSVMQWDAKQDRTEALRRYAPALTGEASGAVAAVSDAAAGFGMQRAAATGVTIETGTGGKAPENPYALSGAEPSKVVACGKNLLDDSVLASSGFKSQGEHEWLAEMSSTPYRKRLWDNVSKMAGAMTISFDIRFALSNEAVGCYPAIVYTDGTSYSLGRLEAISNKPTAYVHAAYSTPEDKTIDYIEWTFSTGGAQTYIKDMQLEQGTAPTAYTPYTGAVYPLPALTPLYGNGAISDEYDLVTGAETRRWKRVELDGTESWGLSHTASGSNRYYLRAPESVSQTSASQIVCSHWPSLGPGQTWEDKTGITLALGTTDKCIYLYDPRFAQADLPAFKTFLSEQYAAGTPATVLYQLAEPVMTQHDPQDITQPEAAMSVLADGGAEMDIRYNRDLNIALLDQIEYTTALEARIAQLEILVNPQ